MMPTTTLRDKLDIAAKLCVYSFVSVVVPLHSGKYNLI